jgi:hypothetical protein
MILWLLHTHLPCTEPVAPKTLSAWHPRHQADLLAMHAPGSLVGAGSWNLLLWHRSLPTGKLVALQC